MEEGCLKKDKQNQKQKNENVNEQNRNENKLVEQSKGRTERHDDVNDKEVENHEVESETAYGNKYVNNEIKQIVCHIITTNYTTYYGSTISKDNQISQNTIAQNEETASLDGIESNEKLSKHGFKYRNKTTILFHTHALKY
ncbi:unnamed protein product [Didymodactylos carnosus]|uniref:Uncharacterized protein n=1 Tax=Didymodactylos carnosus TaxID=1234261 RepID=A0A814B0U1_9BILA|nr:unnamed protein product [Didymodactylos carnosus]CAF3699017.1 unnamed protein product [Didymodactylos carnosus]